MPDRKPAGMNFLRTAEGVESHESEALGLDVIFRIVFLQAL